MSSFLQGRSQGKSAGDFVKDNLTPEGIYECVLSYMKYDPDKSTLLVGADTISVKGKDGKPIRLFLRHDLDIVTDKDWFDDLKKSEDFFAAMKVNAGAVNFFTFLFEIGCLKNEEGGVYFSPPSFFGRKITIRVSHSTNEQTGRTYANSNLVLNRRSMSQQPIPQVQGYVAPEGFSETGNAIVKAYKELQNAGVLTALAKLREDIGFKSVPSGLYLLTVKSFVDKNGSVNLGVNAIPQNAEDKTPSNVSLRLRLADLEEVQKLEELTRLCEADKGQSVTSEKDFVGFQFYAELKQFEWKGNEYNSIESIIGNSQTALELSNDDSDPFAEALDGKE